MANTEQVSTPDPVVSGNPSGVTGAGAANTPATTSVGAAAPVGEELTEADFKKDGGLRKDTIRRIEDEAPARGGSRSFNEITNETTVVTSVGGKTVTFVEEGDTRSKGHPRETGMDSLARAFDDANEAKE